MSSAEYHRNYYASRSKDSKDRKLSLQKIRRKEIAAIVQEYKKTLKCKCGENHPSCLEFHHVNNDKIIDISSASCNGWSIKRLAEEIAKCVVLCSNCHKKLHYNEKQGIA